MVNQVKRKSTTWVAWCDPRHCQEVPLPWCCINLEHLCSHRALCWCRMAKMCCLGDETQKGFCVQGCWVSQLSSVLVSSAQSIPLLGSAQLFLCMGFAVHVKSMLQEHESVQSMLAWVVPTVILPPCGLWKGTLSKTAESVLESLATRVHHWNIQKVVKEGKKWRANGEESVLLVQQKRQLYLLVARTTSSSGAWSSSSLSQPTLHTQGYSLH